LESGSPCGNECFFITFKVMSGYDVIIIGAGLGGLSAGAILSRQGKRVIVLEQHYIPGGCATTFKRREFVMEAGLHAMDGHLISPQGQKSILRYLGVRKKVRFQPLPEFFHMRKNDLSFTFPTGNREVLDALIEKFPGEEKGIRKFMAMVFGVQNELARFPKSKWRQAVNVLFFPFIYPNIFRSFGKTVGGSLDRYIKDEDLKLILQGNLLYYHDDPYTMSMTFFSKAQASFIQYGGYFIRGGSQKLSDSIAEVIRENRGTILLGKRVTRILTEKGKAVGVEYRDSFNQSSEPAILRARTVIHGGAVPLVRQLLSGSPARKIARKINRLQPSCSLFCVYMGFAKSVSQFGNRYYSTFIFSGDTLGIGDIRNINHGDWYKKPFVFVDYSQVDSALAPEGKSVGAICAADDISGWEGLDEEEYRAKKARVARILMDRLENAIPGITGLIETYEVGTPLTIKRYTMNPTGSPYGFAQIRGQVGYRRPSYRSPVRNLWLAGTGTFPGGGFTGAIISGFFCGLRVSRQLDRGTPVTGTETLQDERRVKLVKKEWIAHETMELTFEKPAGFIFQPGQYAIVSLAAPAFKDLDMPFRSLSIASHPEEQFLRFAMRTGTSSFKRSCEALEPGDEATIFGPDGEFRIRDRREGIVFITAGIGITPVMPMLAELKLQQYARPVFLFSCNRNAEKAPYGQQLASPGLKDYTYVPVLSASQGRITPSLLSGHLPEPAKFEYYVVGGTGFLESVRGILRELGIPPGDILLDDFG
jgi:all-trans-retinol 13,14-reductase